MATCCCEDCCQSWKTSVRAATVENLAATRVGNVLTADADGTLTVDDVLLLTDNEFLVKNQTAKEDNGPYRLVVAGSPTSPWVAKRTDNADQSCDFVVPVMVAVSEGSANADTVWMLINDEEFVLNVTEQVWERVAEPGMTDKLLFSSITSTTITNTTSELTLIGAGVGSLTIKGNTLTALGPIRSRTAGVITTGLTPGTLQIRVYYGSTVIFDTTAVVPPSSLSSRTWVLDLQIAVSPGPTGTMLASGYFKFATAAQGTQQSWEGGLGPVVVDTSTDKAWNVTAQWGTASVNESITGQQQTLYRAV